MRIYFFLLFGIIFFGWSNIYCQNRHWDLGIYGGINISNVYDYSSDGGQYFFLFGGERPFYSINFNLGFSAEKDLFKNKSFKNKFLLGFEKFSSSINGFNEENYAVGGFLNIAALTYWKPDQKNDIFIFVGPSYNLLIQSDLPFIGREWESTIFMIQSGINFQIFKRLNGSVIWNEPLTKLRGNITGPSIIDYSKVRSFQFVLGYSFLRI